jgi:hypothetical protein
MSYSEQWLKKQKYFEKLLSTDALYSIYLRSLDMSELFAMYAWLQLTPFDLTQLGLGLLYSVLPVDLTPFSLDFTYELPSVSEALQGIWANFEPVSYGDLYRWTTSFDGHVGANFQEPYVEPILSTRIESGTYDQTYYGRSSYDPYPAREMVRTTFLRLRLLRTPDVSWRKDTDEVTQYLKAVGVTDEHIFNRLMMVLMAQREAFVLGLGLLGRSRLTETSEGWGTVPVVGPDGEPAELRFTTLDQLQMGLVLGMAPLGYGLLLPKQSVYYQEDGRADPPFLEAVVGKIRGIVQRASSSTWSYTNYSTPYETGDYHRSERTAQYHGLMAMREAVEGWVAQRVPASEANPVRVRQYQNAVLQAISWRAKRHRWGFDGWTAMTEEQFKDWWKLHWKGQGLNEATLDNLYTGMSVWLKRLREEKVSLGERTKEIRRRMSLLA